MASSVLKIWAMLRSCCTTPVTLRRLRANLPETTAPRPTMAGADGWEDFKPLSVGLFWRWTNGTGMIGCPFRNGEIAHPTSGDSLMQCQAASPGKACATANNGCSRVRRHSRNICRSHWIEACPHVSPNPFPGSVARAVQRYATKPSRRRLSAMASLFEFLCDKNAVTHNPVKGFGAHEN